MKKKLIIFATALLVAGSAISVSANEWKKDTTGWWYQHTDGSYPMNKWEQIDGKWYAFDGNGYMRTGWFQDGAKWYYLNADGSMATNTTIEGCKIGADGVWIEESNDQAKPVGIVFQDIPWGANFNYVNQKLENLRLWNLSGEIYKTCSVDDVLLGDYKGLDFEYSGINVISNAWNGEQDIAGYKTSDITLYFSYLPVNGYLTYDVKDTALYAAQYEFEPVSYKDMYADLTEKLTLLYGNYTKITEDEDIWKNKYTYIKWVGENDTEVVLRGRDSSGDTTDLYNDEITISYAWRGGDTLLKNASDAAKKAAIEKESNNQGNGNTNGL